MHLKKKIAVKICVALAAVSFLHPFSGEIAHAETVSEVCIAEETEQEETEQTETSEEETMEEKERAEETEKEPAQEKETAEEKESAEETEKEQEKETAEEKESVEETEKEPAQEKETAEEKESAEEREKEAEKITADEEKEDELQEEETVEKNVPSVKRLARSSSIGISQSNPKKGQKNHYEYTGSEIKWTVPMTGYYKITVAGAKGGDGSSNCAGTGGVSHSSGNGAGGNTGSAIFKINAGSALKIAAGGCGGNGQWRKGGGSGGVGGFPNGINGGVVHDEGSEWASAAAGGSGGSSYVKCNETKILEAQGGYGGYGKIKYGVTHRAESPAGGGADQVQSFGDSIYIEGKTFSNNSNLSNGYVTIEIIGLCVKVKLDAPKEWTNQDVEITAEVVSEGEGLFGEYLSWETDENGNDIWTDKTSHQVSQNGTYVCKIRDVDGNLGEASIEVKNIDKLQPFGEISADKTDWTKEDVILTITADDAGATAEDGKSGLADVMYLWECKDETDEMIWEMSETEGTDGKIEQEEEWTDNGIYTASQNGTYLCRIRDKAGNEAVCEYIVNKIDRTAPEITYERAEKWYEGSTNIIWHGEDVQPDGSVGCGLHELAYSFDGVNFDSQNRQYVEVEGVYCVWVRDRLGNVTEAEADMKYDKKSEISKEEEKEETKKEETKGKTEKKIEEKLFLEEIGWEELLLEETEEVLNERQDEFFRTINEIAQPERKETEPLIEMSKTMFTQVEEEQKEEKKENSQKKIIEKETKNPYSSEEETIKPMQRRWGWKKAVLYTVWMAAVICGLIWLLFCLLFEHVTVYRRERNGRYSKIGRCAIIRKKEYLQVNLIHLMKKDEQYDYMLRFSGVFVCFHKKRKVLIRTNVGVELRKMAEKIEIR